MILQGQISGTYSTSKYSKYSERNKNEYSVLGYVFLGATTAMILKLTIVEYYFFFVFPMELFCFE